MVKAYWIIGQEIVEEEQRGKKREKYEAFILNELSMRLTKELGKGFSLSTLKDIRQFYMAYKDSPIFTQKSHTLRGEFQELSSNLS